MKEKKLFARNHKSKSSKYTEVKSAVGQKLLRRSRDEYCRKKH